jgi:YcxB-like protein
VPADAVTVTYRIAVDDVMRASAAAARRSRGTQFLGVLTTAVCAAGLIFLGDLLSIAGVAIGLGIATGWIMAPLVWRPARARYGPDGAMETMVANASGVRFRTGQRDDRQPWTAYRRVDDAGGYYLLDDATGVAQVLPKGAFKPDELATFQRLLAAANLTSR